MERGGEMMAMSPGAGEDTSACGGPCEGSRETFLGDFEVTLSGWDEERVRRAFSSSGFWPLLWVLMPFEGEQQRRALKPCA